jgi:hypothetical protein
VDCGWTLRPVQYHQFEQVRRPIRAQHEIPVRVLADLIDRESVNERVLNVLGLNAMAQRRTQNVHH